MHVVRLSSLGGECRVVVIRECLGCHELESPVEKKNWMAADFNRIQSRLFFFFQFFNFEEVKNHVEKKKEEKGRTSIIVYR